MPSPEISKITFIGSVVVPGEKREEVLSRALRLACAPARKRQDAMIHFPQTPQLGPEFSMNQEATKGFPFLQKVDGKLVYDFIVEPDIGGGGEIIPGPDIEGQFDQLELTVSSLILAVQEGDREEADRALEALVQDYHGFDWQPAGMEILLAALKDGSPQLEERPIKIQISGPINTGQSLYAYDKEGELVQGVVLQNKRMRDIHAGLILARSMLWAKTLAPYAEDGTVCSFDEPCLETLDNDYGGPRTSTVLDVYQTVWGNPVALSYQRFIHVCGSFVPELLDYVDYLNFDALKKGELVVGHGPAIQEFMRRGGCLVPGVVPTNAADLESLLKGLGGSGKVEDLFREPELKAGLIEICRRRAISVVDHLEEEGVSRDLALEHILISPQCGLGGWAKLPHGGRYSALAYGLTVAVADRVFAKD
ncbi:hypothetical protein ISS86_01085 [Candidatus Microgenomates bacterium]|nr:hypothetical protein [Candidatus Microgenomates bacterium]